MRIVRSLIWMVAILIIGWSAGWYILAGVQETAVSTWFEARERKGWQADFTEVSVSGYPAAFERRIEAPKLADPETGWAWEAPWVAASSPAWLPNRLDVVLPPEQRFAVPGERVRITSDRFTANLKTEPNTALELIDAGIHLAALGVASEGDWKAGAETAQVQINRRPPGGAPENSYTVDVNAETVLLPDQVLEFLDPSGVLQPEVDRFELKGDATLTRPLDREMVETGAFNAQTLQIRKASFHWGDMALTAKGKLAADAKGYAAGEIKLHVKNWKRMLEIAQSSGAVSEDIASAIAAGIRIKERLFKRDGVIITLEFNGGDVLIGPFRVANAPRMIR